MAMMRQTRWSKESGQLNCTNRIYPVLTPLDYCDAAVGGMGGFPMGEDFRKMSRSLRVVFIEVPDH
jgi:hypothetical protein